MPPPSVTRPAKEGKYVQSFDNYEDLPDRVLVTTRKYVRISDEEIEHKYVYTNDHPEVVIVAEPTIVKGINVLKGMPEGGLLLINSHREIDYLLKFIPECGYSWRHRHGGCGRHLRSENG